VDPVPIIAVASGSYLPKSTMPEPKGNPDAAQVAESAAARPKPIEVQKYAVELQQTVEAAAKDIQKFVSAMERNVKLGKDETTGYYVVQLIDPQSGQVIRSLPPDELLRIARSFEILGSKMVNQRA